MSTINPMVSEQELKDIRYALLAIENIWYPNDPAFADEGSRQITIGVLHNLLTPDGVERWIASKAKQCFTVQSEKGRGR